ncbi:hypothetical protein CXB51_003244 [Gossypium anomalum]|uniref:Reverse transcriptase zinc-binding domain-containing protein n=1 Tax=Gossypium anomalum TaxID=47600 RepID=A0A8J6DAG3_9ROSI|nr:hypothetical protein CXB51_003244 [Gossypium anomalum]
MSRVRDHYVKILVAKFTWRSIWGTRSVLESGMRWRIGDGKSVNIWNDAWLIGVFVIYLLEEKSCLSKKNCKPFHKLCKFSDYQFIMSRVRDHYVKILVAKFTWRSIWGTRSVSRIGHAMENWRWKITSFIMSRVRDHYVKILVAKFTWRSIWGTRSVLESGMRWRIGDGKSVNIWNDAWLPGEEKLQFQNIDYRELFATRYQDWRGDRPVEYTAKSDYKQCEATTCKFNMEKTQWEPPTESHVNVNFDIAFNEQSNKVVSKIIIRNHMGLVMGSSTYPINNIHDQTTAEAYACLHELVIGGIINDTRKSKKLQAFCVSCVPPEANGAVHTMAAWGKGSVCPTYWLEETSLEFQPIV